MLKVSFLLLLLTSTASLHLADPLLEDQGPAITTANNAATPEAIAKTIQIALSGDADLLVENANGKRVGQDFKIGKFVNEIPGARVISRESSATFVLPFHNSGQPYKLTVSGRSAAKVDADLTMTGPGFVSGFKNISLTSGQLQQLTMATDGVHLSLTANHDGPAPQIFLTTQSGRGQPSYRFEISSPLLRMGKTITIEVDSPKGRLFFKTDEAAKTSFAIKIRRTNPTGTRDLFTQNEISFARSNSYAADFRAWDGKSEMCFFEVCAGCEEQCTKLKNESFPQ